MSVKVSVVMNSIIVGDTKNVLEFSSEGSLQVDADTGFITIREYLKNDDGTGKSVRELFGAPRNEVRYWRFIY